MIKLIKRLTLFFYISSYTIDLNVRIHMYCAFLLTYYCFLFKLNNGMYKTFEISSVCAWACVSQLQQIKSKHKSFHKLIRVRGAYGSFQIFIEDSDPNLFKLCTIQNTFSYWSRVSQVICSMEHICTFC
jgi:hypothetical protein